MKCTAKLPLVLAGLDMNYCVAVCSTTDATGVMWKFEISLITYIEHTLAIYMVHALPSP